MSKFFKKIPIDFSKGKKTPLKTAIVGGIGFLSALYILAPTLGLFELLPDSLPIVGNLDEFTAALLIMSSLKYFGVDLINMFGGEESGGEIDNPDQPRYEPPPK